MWDKVIKMKLMNKHKQHISLNISSINTNVTHSRDR